MTAVESTAGCREQLGLSSAELPEQAGSLVMIGRYERGCAVPFLRSGQRITEALKVSWDALVEKECFEEVG